VLSSLSTGVYKKGSGMLQSYYAVCNKAYDLNRDQQEFDLLAARIRTFIRKCLYAQEFELAVRFRRLLNYIENPGWQTELIVFMCRLHLPVNFAYRFYIKNLKKVTDRRKDLAFELLIRKVKFPMPAEFIKIYPQNPDERRIRQVVDCLRDGGLVIYPTDTVYGLAAIFTTPAPSKKSPVSRESSPRKTTSHSFATT
jgi:hypothetical protein